MNYSWPVARPCSRFLANKVTMTVESEGPNLVTYCTYFEVHQTVTISALHRFFSICSGLLLFSEARRRQRLGLRYLEADHGGMAMLSVGNTRQRSWQNRKFLLGRLLRRYRHRHLGTLPGLPRRSLFATIPSSLSRSHQQQMYRC